MGLCALFVRVRDDSISSAQLKLKRPGLSTVFPLSVFRSPSLDGYVAFIAQDLWRRGYGFWLVRGGCMNP